MQSDGESKKQTRLAWMEKLLIGVSLLLMVGFGAVLFGVPFLNDAVIRKAQKSVAKALGAGPDPKLLQSGSSSSYGGGGWNGQLGEKCPMKRIAITLDVDTPLNRQASELLAKKLHETGKFEIVQFFGTNETATQDFDRWVSLHFDESRLASSITHESASDGKIQTKVELKYFAIVEPTHQTLRQQDFPILDPLINVDDGVEMRQEFTYRGNITLDDIRPILPEKIVEDISRRILGAQERHEKAFGELPSDLPGDFWPHETSVTPPIVLNDFTHRQIRSTHGFLTSSDALWVVEVPSMELRDFYRRIQAELLSKGFAGFTQYRAPLKLEDEKFKIREYCIAISKSPDHNDFWEIYPVPRPELIGDDHTLKEKVFPAATTRLYLHYTRVLPAYEYRKSVSKFFDDPHVSLDKILMFRKVLASEDKVAFEKLLKQFESPENDLMLSMIRFEANCKDMTEDDRRSEWKRLFIRQLKEAPDERFDSVLSRTIDWKVKQEIFATFADELRAAGISELVEATSVTARLKPGDVFSAFLADPAGTAAIAKTYLYRKPTGELDLRQAIHSNSGYSSISPSLTADGKAQSLNIGYNKFRIEGTARLLDPITGEVEVELTKKP